ncbi:MAG: YdcF family protein, partial [Clostridia bacterium]
AGRLQKVLEVERDFDVIVLAGGAANENANIPEALVMRDYLVRNGVKESKFMLEDLSLTTKQNALFCAPIIESLGVNHISLLSSSAHIKRWYLNPVRLFHKYTKCKIDVIEA